MTTAMVNLNRQNVPIQRGQAPEKYQTRLTSPPASLLTISPHSEAQSKCPPISGVDPAPRAQLRAAFLPAGHTERPQTPAGESGHA